MVAWSQKHFETVAGTVNDTLADGPSKNYVCDRFADKFEPENRKFDRGQFLKKCGFKK